MAYNYSKSISNISSDTNNSKSVQAKVASHSSHFSSGRMLKSKKLSIDVNSDKNSQLFDNYASNSGDFPDSCTLIDPSPGKNGRIKIKRPKSALGPFFSSTNSLGLHTSANFNNPSSLAASTLSTSHSTVATKQTKKSEKNSFFYAKEESSPTEFSNSFSQLFLPKSNGAGLSASLQGSLFKASSSVLAQPIGTNPKNARTGAQKGYLFGRQR